MAISALSFIERDGVDMHVDTAPLSLAAEADVSARLYPEYNGYRINKAGPGDRRMWLIDRGQKRYIPNMSTFDNLFRDRRYHEVLDIDAIETGPSITDGAMLARAAGTQAIYLIDRGVRRHIVTDVAMVRYNFNEGRVVQLPRTVLESISPGESIG